MLQILKDYEGPMVNLKNSKYPPVWQGQLFDHSTGHASQLHCIQDLLYLHTAQWSVGHITSVLELHKHPHLEKVTHV